MCQVLGQGLQPVAQDLGETDMKEVVLVTRVTRDVPMSPKRIAKGTVIPFGESL